MTSIKNMKKKGRQRLSWFSISLLNTTLNCCHGGGCVADEPDSGEVWKVTPVAVSTSHSSSSLTSLSCSSFDKHLLQQSRQTSPAATLHRPDEDNNFSSGWEDKTFIIFDRFSWGGCQKLLSYYFAIVCSIVSLATSLALASIDSCLRIYSYCVLVNWSR